MSTANSLKLLQPLALIITLLILPHPLTAAKPRPNILFAFADDWGRYAGAYAEIDNSPSINDVADTPAFDRVAKEGVLFRHAFVNAPSCTPCRSALLSGQYFFRTGRGAILQGAVWDANIPTFPLLLRDAGYHIGHTYKVWSPGTPKDAPFGGKDFAYVRRGGKFNGFSQNATRMVQDGKTIAEAKRLLLDEVAGNFADFLEARPDDTPFCYWFGPTNVHRKWVAGSGKNLWGIDPDRLKGKLPSFLPDVPVVRQDVADYLGEVKAFDMALQHLLDRLESMGELDNTIVVVSGDHGAPGFPRGKCNLYDFGVAVPLAIRFPRSIPGGRVLDDFVNLMDLAPTFLEIGGVAPPAVMTGRSLLPILESETAGQVDPTRDFVITGRERHVARAREDFLPYPHRAIRTKDYLYIANFKPDRWPMGTPQYSGDDYPTEQKLTNDTFVAFADLDASPTKAWMVRHQSEAPDTFALGFGKRPAEELYVLANDRDQVHNVADDPTLSDVKARLRNRLLAQLRRHGDPRVMGDGETFERPPFALQP